MVVGFGTVLVVSEAVFYFVEKMTEVPYPPKTCVEGRIFLCQFDETYYLSLPHLAKVEELIEEVKVWLNQVNRLWKSSLRIKEEAV